MDLDPLPGLVADFVLARTDGRVLLGDFRRQVATVSRRYPDCWFTLGRKTPEAVDDLAARAFTTCARVKKGRFPFSGREPFRAYVEEQFDGRTVRYHSFYARLSITRELMRGDYLHNVGRDPVLGWRARLYREVGAVLRAEATAIPRGRGQLPCWALARPARVRKAEALTDELRTLPTRELRALVLAALERGGPRTQAQLMVVLEPLLHAPAEPTEEHAASLDLADQMALREAVSEAWSRLDGPSREVLRLLASGVEGKDIVGRVAGINNGAAVTRRIEAINKIFLGNIRARLAGTEALTIKHHELALLILDVLQEVVELEDP